MPTAEKLPMNEKHWQEKQIKFRLNAGDLSSATGAGEQHGQVNTHDLLQPVTTGERKTLTAKVKVCQTLLSQSASNSLKRRETKTQETELEYIYPRINKLPT